MDDPEPSPLDYTYSSKRRAESAKKLSARWKDPEWRAKRLDLVAPSVVCEYCSRTIRGRGNLVRHELACSKNPDRPPRPRPRKDAPPRVVPTHSFIYALVDPRTSEPRYVGWTTDLRYRRGKHLKAARRAGKKTYVAYWVQSLLLCGIEPEMVVLEEDPVDYAGAERSWIARYRAAGYRLTNLTDGGDGAPGYRHTPETIQLLREMFTDKPLSAEHRAAISAGQKGREFSPETRAKLSAAHKGKVKSPEHLAKLSAAKRGKKQSPEHAAKSREIGRAALTDLNKSAEHRARVVARLTGKKLSEETKAKMSIAAQKRCADPEYRAKMSRARRGVKIGPSESVVCERCGKTVKARGLASHQSGKDCLVT